MHRLSSSDRLRLFRFVCSFAWADLEIRQEERAYVARLLRRFQLPEDEVQLVRGWLERPPRAEDIDPMDIPDEQKRLFLETARAMIEADGFVDERESETFGLLEALLNPGGTSQVEGSAGGTETAETR